MRIATYNQQCGWNGQCLRSWSALYWHYFRKDAKRIESGANLSRTLETLEKVDADVVGIQEVFGPNQAHELKQQLRAKGYQHFSLGCGRTFSQEHPIHTLLASRLEAEHIPIPKTGAFGDGHDGGLAGLYVPEQNISLVTLHLPFSHQRRLQSLEKYAHLIFEPLRTNTRQVVLGDFNSSHRSVEKHVPFFKDWEKISSHEKTCSTTPFIKYFFGSDLDHMLAKGVRAKDSGTLHTCSDHKLVWVDLEV